MKSEILKKIGATSVLLIIFVGCIALAISPKKDEESFIFKDMNKVCSGKWCVFENEGRLELVNESNAKPADKEKWYKLYEDIKNIDTKISLSENKANFTNYGIDDKNIEIDGEKIWIGSITDDLSQTYIAINDKIYKINTLWDKNGLTSENYWLNQTLTNFPIYQIQKLTIEKDGKTREIVIDANKPPEYLNKLTYIMGVEWVDYKIMSKVAPKSKITIFGEGDSKVISIGEAVYKGKKIYWGQDESGYYEIEKVLFDTLKGIK